MTALVTPDAEAPSDRSLDRLVTFTDAVVAIAITLVVLPLVDSARELDGRSTTTFLRENLDALVAAGISFAVIGTFWRDHHRLFLRARGTTTTLLRLNQLWLAGIVILPLTTVLQVAAERHDRIAVALYLGTIALVMAVARLLEVVLIRAGLLVGTDHLERVDVASRWVLFGLLLVAAVIALVWPATNLWPLLLLFFQGPVRHVVRRVVDRRPAR